MRFIETWLPLVVLVRERALDDLEMQQMSTGFERLFKRGAPFAVLSLAEPQAPPMDALGRQRIAQWSSQPRVQRLSKKLCAGSATVVARKGEHRALTALSWSWTQIAPHDAVHTIVRGVDFCVARLVEWNVPLPAPHEAFRDDIARGLSGLSVAAPEAPGLNRASARPSQRSGTHRIGQLERLTHGNGQIVLGWLEHGVLWAAFEGHLSSALASLYAERLEQLLHRRKAVLYFVDASGISIFDLLGRSMALHALLEHRHRFASVSMLEWPGGAISNGVTMLQGLGDLLQTSEDRNRFVRKLAAVAPAAQAALAAFELEDPTGTRWPLPQNR